MNRRTGIKIIYGLTFFCVFLLLILVGHIVHLEQLTDEERAIREQERIEREQQQIEQDTTRYEIFDIKVENKEMPICNFYGAVVDTYTVMIISYSYKNGNKVEFDTIKKEYGYTYPEIDFNIGDKNELSVYKERTHTYPTYTFTLTEEKYQAIFNN